MHDLQIDNEAVVTISEQATDSFADVRMVASLPPALSLLTLPLLPFIPARVGRWTSRVPLFLAFLVHVLGAMAVTAVVICGVAVSEYVFDVLAGPTYQTWAGSSSGTAAPSQPLTSYIINAYANFFAAFADKEVLFFTGLGVLVGEMMLMLIGGSAAAVWCARDEPLNSSYKTGLNRLWLFTPAMVLVTLLALAVNIPLNRWMMMRIFTGGPPNFWDTLAMASVSLASMSFSFWTIWALFRFIGSDRATGDQHRPPMCEECGYNLTMQRADGSCPECGQSVATSMGTGTRPGTNWARRRQVGWFYGWFSTAIAATLHPRHVGKAIRIRSHCTDHRLFLVVAILLNMAVGVLGWTAAMGYMAIAYGSSGFSGVGWIDLIMGLVMIPMWTIHAVLLVTFLSAVVSGLSQSFLSKRNMLAAGMRGACYASGFLIVVQLLIWLGLLVTDIGYQSRMWRSLADMLNMYDDMLIMLLWILFAGVLLCIHVAVTGTMALSTRYANR